MKINYRYRFVSIFNQLKNVCSIISTERLLLKQYDSLKTTTVITGIKYQYQLPNSVFTYYVLRKFTSFNDRIVAGT